MGRRKKAAKKIVQKKKHVVPTQFKCLFCNSEGSVACKLNLVTMVGRLQCRVCDAQFETQINSLTDPIDVFSEWLDEAEELQEKHMAAAAAAGGEGDAYVPGGGGDDEGGVEMVEPAAKRARTEEPAAAAPDLSEPNFDVLKGLDDSDDEGERGDNGEKKAEVEGTGSDKEDREGEGEGNETWKDVASPVPPAKEAAAPEAATQPQADVEATQAQGGDEDLF